MSELGRPFLHPDERRLIEVDRAAPDPPDVVKRKVAQRLDRSLALGGAMLASQPALGLEPPPFHDPGPASLPPPPPGMLRWKAMAGAAVAVVIGGAAALSWLGRAKSSVAPGGAERTPAVVEARLGVTTTGVGALLEDSQATAPVTAAPAAKAVPEVARASRGPAESNVVPRSTRRRARAASAPGPIDTLAAERIVLDGARSALVRRDAAGALAALRAHEQSFPRGQLLEERESMRVQALALARDFGAARATGDKFRRRFPESMFLPAVDRALAAAP